MSSIPRIGFAPLDSSDRVKRDTESFGDLFVGSGARSNLSNLFVGKKLSSVLLFGLSSNLEGVRNAFAHGQELKVFEPVIGLLAVDMVHGEMIGDRPVEDEPNETVNENPISLSFDHERGSMIMGCVMWSFDRFKFSFDPSSLRSRPLPFDSAIFRYSDKVKIKSAFHVFKCCGFHTVNIAQE